MVDVALQGVRVLYRISKHQVSASSAFSKRCRQKYSKEGGLSSAHEGIRNMPPDVCYVMMAQNIARSNLNPGLFRTPSNICDAVFLHKRLTA